MELEKILTLTVREDISRAKLIEENKLDTFHHMKTQLAEQFAAMRAEI
jgi:hypothetical protein